MIRADMIPHEAMNALLRALQLRKGGREALAAAINAWPQLWVHPYTKNIILPLPMDDTNDQA